MLFINAINFNTKIYRNVYSYNKAGVILNGLSKASVTKGLLDYDREISDSLMKTMDTINTRYGSSTLKLAAEGIEKKWKMKRKKISPCYTTRFEEVLRVKNC